MKALITKKVQVERNPRNASGSEVGFIGMNKKITVFFLIHPDLQEKRNVY